MRDDSGQGTTEYLALSLLVMIVLGAATALTSGGLGAAVEASIRRGICEVSEQRCPPIHAASLPADLEVCPLARKTGNQQFSVDVGIVRLAAQLGLVVESMSNGKVRVSFSDGARAGLGAAVGAHMRLGPWGARGEAAIDGGAAVTSGRVWVLPSAKAAQSFLSAFGGSQRLDGRLRSALGKVCPLCGVLAGAPKPPPEPDERWISGGFTAGGSLGFGTGPIGGKLEATLRGALGRRTTKTGTTWFMRLDDRVTGILDLFGGGLDAQLDANAVASLETDLNGAPTRLKIFKESKLSTRRGFRLPTKLRQVIGDSRTGDGEVIDNEVTLELASEADREAAVDLLAAGRNLDPAGLLEAKGRLSVGLAQRGVRTVRRWSLSRRVAGVGAGGALGLRLGADASSSTDDQRLTSVATQLPGLGWLPRADCLAV
ncbi:MAG: hypothetical protein F2799_00935 [Actinobacteria bacterium]|uniref:Unannotated protein n=1 Tax=freshwater metagenome TaxID=449393 RepID=A0A6J7CTS2_9ZZZZ|nr:hypothetical protein [Actinomycetota bacterium]